MRQRIDTVEENTPPATDFPMANPAAFVPHWLSIDYKRGECADKPVKEIVK